MLRDKNLVPLSRQHQRALALGVRLDRALKAGAIDLGAWQREITQHFEQEIGAHFAAEEQELFPAAGRFAELAPLVRELLEDHAVLRDLFARASRGGLNNAGLQEFAQQLATHIRKEERQLFEGMQQVMPASDLATVGAALEKALAQTPNTCILPAALPMVRKN